MRIKEVFYVSKKFRFESAHRLTKGYKGKCNNLHGHSWNGEIELRCEVLDANDLSVDFSEIKNRVVKKIEDMFDHKVLLYREDPLYSKISEETDVFLMDENPTSEALARFIYYFAEGQLKGLNCSVNRVVVDETCTSSCVFKVEKDNV